MSVTHSPGIATVAGIAGGGHGRAPQAMRDRLDAAATALTELNDDYPVETRVNSDGQSGGAFLVTVPGGGIWSNAEVGINVHDRDETFTAYVKAVALREDSALRPDLTGYTFDPSRTRGTDRLYGADTVVHEGTLTEVLAFLTVHVRPAAAIVETLTTHRELARAFRVATAWWAVEGRPSDDGAHYVVLARRTATLDWFEREASKDALEQYTRSTRLLRAGSTTPRSVDAVGLRRMLDQPHLDAADLEAGRVYEVTTAGLVPTKYRSAKVAALSAAIVAP